MRPLRGVMLAAGCLAAVVALAHSQGCGSDGNGSGGAGSIEVTGNVTEATGPTVVSSAESAGPGLAGAPAGRFAFWSLFGPSSAVAQACDVDDVFICLETEEDIECEGVNEETCLFSVTIGADSALAVFFVKDEDGDGTPEEGEAGADLTNDLGESCAGLEITLNDVAIDFDAETAVAGSVDRDPESCATPTPEATATPTPEESPAPTTTPTATPTATP